MKTIVVATEKGGVGKTTVAEELAFSFERTGTPFEYRDLDGQGGTRHRGHADEGAVVRIVDMPAALPVDTREDVAAALASADVVVVPMKATPYDVQPLLRTLEVVGNYTKAPVLVVVNMANRFKVASQVLDWVKDKVGESDVVVLPQAEAFPQSQGLGCSVLRLGSKSPAALAIKDMCDEVRSRIGLCVESSE